MPPPSASCQYLPIYSYLFARWRCCSGITLSSCLFTRWHLFLHVGYLRNQQQVDLWPFDLESGVRVKCDMGSLCANFSLPRPLCSRLRPDVRDRQTDVRQIDVRQKHRLMPPPYGSRGIITDNQKSWTVAASILLQYKLQQMLRLSTLFADRKGKPSTSNKSLQASPTEIARNTRYGMV